MVEIVAAELGTVFGGKVINVIDREGKLIIETETDYFALSDAEEKLMRVLRNTVQAYEGLLEMQRMNSGAEIKRLADIVQSYGQKHGAKPGSGRPLYQGQDKTGRTLYTDDKTPVTKKPTKKGTKK